MNVTKIMMDGHKIPKNIQSAAITKNSVINQNDEKHWFRQRAIVLLQIIKSAG
jgi:uncharacterized protein (UPF0147 family)